MLRLPLTVSIHRALSAQLFNIGVRGTATKVPEKIEVFIDDKPVMVEPGTTVLQVWNQHLVTLINQNFNKIT